MSIKKYVFFSLVYIFVVALYVWNLQLEDYTFSLFTYSFTYSVFVWFMAPLVILFGFSLLHILFYSFINFLHNKTIQKDITQLQKIINQKIINNKINQSSIKTPQIKKLADFIECLSVDVLDDKCELVGEMCPKIKYLLKIKNKEYVSSNKLPLDYDNPYYYQNMINKINAKDGFAKEVFNADEDDDRFNDELREYAINKIIQSNTISEIKEIIEDKKLYIDALFALFTKDAKKLSDNKDDILSNDDILKLTKDVEVSDEQYLKIAKIYLKHCDPDRLISLFDDFKSADENAINAYLYILAQYEMLDKLRSVLSSLKPNEAKPYRALVDLKEASKHYKITDFIN